MAGALAAQEYGADLLGFVFAPSKRQITIKQAKEISSQVTGIKKVGVFVNAPLSEVQAAAQECCLDYVQLHGDESAAYCRQVGYPVIKAFRIKAEFCSDEFAGYQPAWTLVDSFSATQEGGTGTAFDWQQTQQLLQQAPKPLMIAGGLTPDNVAQAIAILKPDGVDVSGGVETNGIKDAIKIERFIAAVRGAETCHAN